VTENAGFAPGTETTGLDKVVSLVLPSTATSIKAGTYNAPTFKNFTALTSVSGANITTIGDYAFRNCASLATATFPEAVTIGDCAFANCAALTSVSLPKAESIGEYAFHNCAALTSVSLPVAETIDDYAFANCAALTTASLPVATSIGVSAFYDTALTTVSLPASLTTIDDCAFSSCESLASVSLPASLTTITGNPFSGCTSLTITVDIGNANYQSQNGMLLDKAGTTLIAYPSAKGAVTLNSEVTTIGPHAFAYCTALTSVSLPVAETIDDYAFANCTALTSVSLPAATSIGKYAFCETGTTALTVTLGSTAPTLGYSMFGNIYSAKTVTVKVPATNSGYADNLPATYSGSNATVNWGNGFRGGGWTITGGTGAFSTDFYGGASNINSYITLTIVSDTP
jgi:hypothetical protein